MKTENTGQVSARVVKAPGVLHEKIATQHRADLYSLIEKPEMDVCIQETESGRISQERLQENMEAALQDYLDRVNEILFGSSVIKMYRGATDQQAAQ